MRVHPRKYLPLKEKIPVRCQEYVVSGFNCSLFHGIEQAAICRERFRQSTHLSVNTVYDHLHVRVTADPIGSEIIVPLLRNNPA
jgi:hypothetical protein